MKNFFEEDKPFTGNISGPFSGTLMSDGRILANFVNKTKYGLSGDVTLNFSTEAFSEELGESQPGEEQEQEEEPLSQPSVVPSPTPMPTPDPKELIIYGLNERTVEGAKVTLVLKNGEKKEVEVKNGKINFDANETRTIIIQGEDGRSLQITKEGFDKKRVILANEEEWKQHFMSELERYARILNDGEPVDLNKYFKINWDSDENSHQPPLMDWLRKIGFKDKINFFSDDLTKKSNIDTPAHEALGHALTEVIGEGNELEHAGYDHSDIWQPGWDNRGVLNPMRWFKGKIRPLADEEARGFAFSEGWAQYVGDKWQRELTDVIDQESEYTTENAIEKMNAGREGISGKMYADQPAYGAKVEAVVATVLNEIYKNQALEEAIEDYTKTRKAFKGDHNGRTIQNVNEYLEQKLKMSQDEEEKNRIRELMVTLELEEEK